MYENYKLQKMPNQFTNNRDKEETKSSCAMLPVLLLLVFSRKIQKNVKNTAVKKQTLHSLQ